MSAKDYLAQAYRLDQRINSKLDQIQSLNELATKCTSTLSDMPRNPNRATSSMAETIEKIIDLQNEINHEIDHLVNLKRQIFDFINSIDNQEYKDLLEKRYLCFYTWDKISSDLNYSLRWIHIMHSKALIALEQNLKEGNLKNELL